MVRKIFTAKLDPNNPFDCYDEDIKRLARGTPIANNLLLNQARPLRGISAKPGTNHDNQRHHVYPTMLFPIKRIDATLIIKVSSERHLELHKLIAEEKYAEYEAAIKAESSGAITDDIEQIFLDRIAAL